MFWVILLHMLAIAATLILATSGSPFHVDWAEDGIVTGGIGYLVPHLHHQSAADRSTTATTTGLPATPQLSFGGSF